jgi:hypothetical protein
MATRKNSPKKKRANRSKKGRTVTAVATRAIKPGERFKIRL